MPTMRSILLVIYDWGEERIDPFKIPPGGGVENVDGIGSEDTPNRLHLFEFPSGTRKEEVKKNNIHEKTLLIPLTIETAEAYLEAR